MNIPVTINETTMALNSCLLLIAVLALIKINAMKKQQVNALVIYTVLLGKKNYISTHTMRADNRFIVEYTTNVEEAKAFVTEQEAQTYISRIYNLHHREYQTEPAMVPQQSIDPVKLPKENLA